MCTNSRPPVCCGGNNNKRDEKRQLWGEGRRFVKSTFPFGRPRSFLFSLLLYSSKKEEKRRRNINLETKSGCVYVSIVFEGT